MGGCLSGGQAGDAESIARNKELAKQLKADAAAFKSEIRLLLLGAGESGKSTIAKQMKIIHMNGFTPDELESYKALIHQNAYGGAKILCQQADSLCVKIGKKARSVSKKILDDDDYFAGELTPAQGKDLAALWEDSGIQKVFERRSEYQLSDSVPYYLDNITRIAAEDFVPTEQDVLRSRAKTTGIIETDFMVDGTKFKMVDVGGQRSERKKWMHCFQDVTAVIFCVALSEYDLKLEEDGETNRMHESINLFNQISNSKWFQNTAMILFLNKRDLFEEKLKKITLTVTFPEYSGSSGDWEHAAKFIEDKFVDQNKSRKGVYPHVTCATDTGNVRFVFNAVKDIILQQTLDSSGLAF